MPGDGSTGPDTLLGKPRRANGNSPHVTLFAALRSLRGSARVAPAASAAPSVRRCPGTSSDGANRAPSPRVSAAEPKRTGCACVRASIFHYRRGFPAESSRSVFTVPEFRALCLGVGAAVGVARELENEGERFSLRPR